MRVLIIVNAVGTGLMVVVVILNVIDETVRTGAKYVMMIIRIVYRFLEKGLGARVFGLCRSIRAR